MKKSNLMKLFIVGFILLFVPFFGMTASAGIEEDYKPILYFEGGETFYPVSVEYFLANSVLSETILEGETIQYYDANDNMLSDYQNKLQSKDSSVGYTVYYRVDTSGGSTVIQYWMFYVFNLGESNQHEGDWEMVQIVLSGSSPTSVAYSQHYSGQSATWDMVEKEGNHFKVYVSRGSHANYLRSYSGKLGIANDIVGDNGKVLTANDYELEELSSQTWLTFEGLWGEVNSKEDFLTGRAGPNGPLYRQDMNGNYMKDGLSWGSGLAPIDSTILQMEWFLYNFITFLIIITALSLALICFKIYRRHKKYGLGPRIVSMFYIDGLNLHTIGNILCFVAIVFAFLGLFNTWYTVSVNIDSEVYQTVVMNDVITIDGLNGIQLFVPSINGPIPMSAVSFPFTYIFIIGFIFMILATIGIHKSHKLGLKYIFKGVRMIVIVVVLIVAIIFMGTILGRGMSGGGTEGDTLAGVIGQMSSSPIGGFYSISLSSFGIEGSGDFAWGLGIGSIYLILSGILFFVAGILMIADKKDFFQPKTPEKQKTKEKKTVVQPVKTNIENKQEQAVDVCPKCGKKLEKDAMFCTGCGEKL
jgi:hypothetical protein